MRALPTALTASLLASATGFADVTFATWDSNAAGTLNGIDFTVTSLSSDDFSGSLRTLFIGEGYDPDAHGNPGQQPGLSYSAYEEYTLTFETAISDLSLYLSGWRSPSKFGYSSYTLSESFTINDAFDGTASGNDITTASGFTNGILYFSGEITSITITHASDGGIEQYSGQMMTLAQNTEPPAVPGGGAAAAIAGIVALGRRRRR